MANIVGILILLVMVVGVRASRAALAPEPESAEHTIAQHELDSAYREAFARQKDVSDLTRRLAEVHASATFRDQERLGMTTYVAAFESEIEQRRDALSNEEQRDFDLRRELAAAQETLEDLTRQQIALMSVIPEVEEVENLPTPLARTVRGDELHLRVTNGRVAFIPLDGLLDEFKQHAESNIWQLRDRSRAINTVGPLNGFRLRYQLEKSDYAIQAARGAIRQGTIVRLTKWELLPVSDALGEPIDQAVMPGSDLMQFLSEHPPGKTSVTVWIYPGSFGEFRTLKNALYELGYATAARPLPDGVLIGGSPNGTKSAVQ